MKPDKSIRFTA